MNLLCDYEMIVKIVQMAILYFLKCILNTLLQTSTSCLRYKDLYSFTHIYTLNSSNAQIFLYSNVKIIFLHNLIHRYSV